MSLLQRINEKLNPCLLGLVLCLGVLCQVLVGCQSVGPQQKFGRTSSEIASGSPVALNIQDDDKIGTLNGTGPGGFIQQTPEGTQAFYVNSNPRNITLSAPDGTQVSIAGGTDLSGKGLEFDRETGNLKIAEFSTVASDGIRASNEAYKDLAPVWISLTQAQRDVAIAEIEASANIAESFKPVLVTFLQSLVPK